MSGLIAPPTVSVVTLDPASSATSVHALATNGFPPNSDFSSDAPNEYVFDHSLDTLTAVNRLLCFISQAKYVEFVNQPPYIAQIDTRACGLQNVGVNAPGASKKLEEWIVRSVRASALEPNRVDCWVPLTDSAVDHPQALFSSLNVFTPPSGANPFGVFAMNFAGTAPGGSVHDPESCGLITTKIPTSGHIGYDFFYLVGDPARLPPVGRQFERTEVNVDFASNQTAGIARISQVVRRNDPVNGDSGMLTDEIRLAFAGPTLVRSHNGGPTQALSRSQYQVCNLRYNLYESSGPAAGSRVHLQTGTSILLADGSHGFLDYYGLYVPPGAQALDGDIVHREENGVVLPEPYTLRVAPGRLIRNTRNTTPLADVMDETFEWDLPYLAFGITDPSRYHLVCDGKDFIATEVFDFVTNQYVPMTPTVVPVWCFGALRMRSNRFGGNVSYVDGDPIIHWYTERVTDGTDDLFGDGQSATLYGYYGCTRPNVTAAEAELGDVYFPDPTTGVDTPYQYEFRKSSFALMYSSDSETFEPVGLAPGAIPRSGLYVEGIRSGPLVTDASQLSSPLGVFDAPVFYIYETGPHAWNQWAGLVDQNGVALRVQEPIQFVYTHSAANDANGDGSQAGRQFLLEYRGDGQLWGIPSKQIDTDDDGIPDQSVPLFNIADGVLVGPTGTEYVVKAIERAFMLVAADSIPPGLDPALADALVLPDGSNYTTPEIGDVPTVNSPPAVVGGTVQSVTRRR